jgi:two-component system chemotaxis sensor kinase CheA
MDALTKAAIESLVKKVLPQLRETLSAVNTAEGDPPPTLDQQGRYLLQECRELLNLVKDGISTTRSPSQSTNPELNDDEAMAIPAPSLNSAGNAAADQTDDPDMSDEEAMALMQAMDDEDTANSPAAAPSTEDMSDEEAQRLLTEMESPQADDNANPTPDSELSDEEARKLLAEMEAPVAQPTTDPAAATTEPPAGANEGSSYEEPPEWESNDFQSDPDMIQDFISNSDDIMNSLDSAILQLEQDPTNKDIIEDIFRGAHTLKGAAGMFGYLALERVMHRLENLFDLIRKDQLNPTSDTVDVVFKGLDLMRELLEAIKNGTPSGAKTAPIVIALEAAARGEAAPITAAPTKPAATAANSTEAATTPNSPNKAAASGSAPAANEPPAPQQAKENTAKKKDQSTIRVDLERLDVLVNLVGELVIDRTRFASIEDELRTNYPQIELGNSISETVQLFGRHMNEIQDIIMKVRMVPIGNAFNKFTRIVRDLARSLDKKIELVISGEQAELDKTMVEQIGDPLIHLIRNSCDHGIERPEDRTAAGKDPLGKIWLSAHQEGNHIVITIQDNGKGMDSAIIRRKAIDRGLIGEDDALTDRDIFNLIFEPGFSTADQVTNISGRGVGMDVVKKQIMKLKGMIEIDSQVGQGTSITIRLPLTLAIVQSLLVRSKGEIFAIPLSSVIESIRISPQDIQKVGDTEVYKLRDKVLPLLHLEDALGLDPGAPAPTEGKPKKKQRPNDQAPHKQERLFIVVVGHSERPTGIIVDQLLNQQEMVIKSMGSLMHDIPCVAGGAVLGHGEVVLVLDIPELEETTKSRFRGLPTHAA